MIFFRHGAAAALHALEGLTRAELSDSLRAAVADYASHTAAKRTIRRGVMYWIRWRRLRRARVRRHAERDARKILSEAVRNVRLRHAALAEAASRRQQRAEERAVAMRSVGVALAQLKHVWQVCCRPSQSTSLPGPVVTRSTHPTSRAVTSFPRCSPCHTPRTLDHSASRHPPAPLSSRPPTVPTPRRLAARSGPRRRLACRGGRRQAPRTPS